MEDKIGDLRAACCWLRGGQERPRVPARWCKAPHGARSGSAKLIPWAPARAGPLVPGLAASPKAELGVTELKMELADVKSRSAHNTRLGLSLSLPVGFFSAEQSHFCKCRPLVCEHIVVNPQNPHHLPLGFCKVARVKCKNLSLEKIHGSSGLCV